MDWLSQTTNYLGSDLRLFKFCPGGPFLIKTVLLRVENKAVVFEHEDLRSEQEYLDWTERSEIRLKADETLLLLVMHVRQDGSPRSIPYSEDTFKTISKKMYQHRSLAFAMPRTSTAIFNSRRAHWACGDSQERSTVYNCRSDTETLPLEDDILISTTYFTEKPWTFSIMYGCPLEWAEDITRRLKRFKRSAFHPLIFPMIFVEYERKRFMNALNVKSPKLTQRILDLENRLETDKQHKKRPTSDSNREMTEKDCEGTRLWVDVNGLKIGLESLKKVLVSIDQHSRNFHELRLRPDLDGANETIEGSMSSEYIVCRLQEMTAEIESKISACEGLLNGMALAIQVEWNYHTRRDAKANIIIAHASKQDSTQMRLISLVGMIFLPGTFLATLFSMSFFRWIPDDSTEMVSPWIAVYFGLTAIITAGTLWKWKTWKVKDVHGLQEFIDEFDYGGEIEKGLTYPDNSQHARISKERSNSDESETTMVMEQHATW